MPVQISFSRATVRLLLAAAPLLFTACTADLNPSPMPTGYKYHSRQYVVSSTGAVQQKVYPGEFPQGAAAAPVTMQPSAGEMQTAMAPVPVASAPVMAPAPMMAPMAPMARTTTTTSTSTVTTAAEPAIVPPLAGDVAPQWKSAASDLLTKTEHDFGRLQDPVYVRDALAGQMGEPEFRAALNSVLMDRHYKIATDKKLAPFAFDYSVGAPAPTGMSAISLTILSQAKPIITEKGDYNLNPGAPVAAAPMPVPAPAPVAAAAPASTPVPAADMTVSATPPAPAPVPAAAAVSGAQKPVIVTGPGSAPPPPVPAMAAVSTPVPDATASEPTYVYDGRSTNAPGRTAYEQRQGLNREVDMAEPDDQGTTR